MHHYEKLEQLQARFPNKPLWTPSKCLTNDIGLSDLSSLISRRFSLDTSEQLTLLELFLRSRPIMNEQGELVRLTPYWFGSTQTLANQLNLTRRHMNRILSHLSDLEIIFKVPSTIKIWYTCFNGNILEDTWLNREVYTPKELSKLPWKPKKKTIKYLIDYGNTWKLEEEKPINFPYLIINYIDKSITSINGASITDAKLNWVVYDRFQNRKELWNDNLENFMILTDYYNEPEEINEY